MECGDQQKGERLCCLCCPRGGSVRMEDYTKGCMMMEVTVGEILGAEGNDGWMG